MKTIEESFINHDTCKKCLFCAEVCPNLLIEKNSEGLVAFKPEFYSLCITCGHCMAVCTTNSMQIEGLDYERDFRDNKHQSIDYNLFYDVLSGRRAIRQYKDKDIEQEKLEKIVQAISTAPVSFTPNSLELTILRKEKMQQSIPEMITFYEDLVKMLSKPVSRFFVKKSVSREIYATLMQDIYPIFSYKLPDIKEKGIDAFYRDAPAAFLIHADKDVVNHTEDGIIAMTYGIITALSLGLGTCPVSLIPPAVNREKSLKQLFNIPENNEVISSFIVGYPKYKYKKNIIRRLKKVEFL